jgi:hypothetical protein
LQLDAACASLAPRLSSTKLSVRTSARSAISICIVSHLTASFATRIVQELATQKGACNNWGAPDGLDAASGCKTKVPD